MKLPARELIPCVSKFILDEWQDIWDCCEGNFILFTPRLALSSIANTFPATIPSCSTYPVDELSFRNWEGTDDGVTHVFLLCRARFVNTETSYRMAAGLKDGAAANEYFSTRVLVRVP